MSGPTTQDDRLERIEQRLEELLDVLVFIEGRLSWLEQLGKPYHRSLPEGRNDEAYARNQQPPRAFMLIRCGSSAPPSPSSRNARSIASIASPIPTTERTTS